LINLEFIYQIFDNIIFEFKFKLVNTLNLTMQSEEIKVQSEPLD